MILFAKWAMKVAAPSAALCAVALAALSTPVIDLSAQMKPYALDLLATVVILYCSDRAMRGESMEERVAVAGRRPLLAGFSFASLLVIAGAIVVGAVAAWLRRKDHQAQMHSTFWLAVGMVATGAYLLFFAGLTSATKARRSCKHSGDRRFRHGVSFRSCAGL